jgi:acetyl esterase/lipase
VTPDRACRKIRLVMSAADGEGEGSWGDRLRQGAGAFATDGFFRSIARAGKLHPLARPERHGVETLLDVPYRDTGLPEHRLDVYRPLAAGSPAPVVLYVHGGGFRILSKDTHWLMALAFSRRNMLVFNINYRLAPRHPYPAAIEDTCAAFDWVVRNAPRFGGDPSRMILAGESAGANLATALAIATCYRRREPFARSVFDLGVTPRAVVSTCGILQVSDPGRFARRRKLSSFMIDRIEEPARAYLGGVVGPDPERELADPLLVLERGEAPARPLPAFFAPVGTRDPLLDDTRRLRAALDKLGVPCEDRYYRGEIHAFHALLFLKNARRCWGHTFAFLERYVPAAAPRQSA